MDKELIKILFGLNIITSYFINLLVMFCYKPISVLIANIAVWIILILIVLGFAIKEWLDD